jgi:hypothetical protein
MKALLNGGAIVDLQDAKGQSGLMLAAEAGHGAAALFLLEKSADVNLVAHTGKLDYKHMGLRETVTKRFYHKMAEPPTNVVGKYMQSRRREDDREELELLEELERLAAEEEEECPVSDRASEGEPDSDAVAHECRSQSSQVSEVALLGERMDWVQVDGEHMDWAQVDMLPGGTFLSKVAPMRPQDLAKPPPEPEVREKLIVQSERLRGVARHLCGVGETALTTAARSGHADICELLLHFGADGSMADGNGGTALSVAARCGHTDVCRVLLTQRPSRHAHAVALKAAEEAGCEAAVRFLRGYEV